ncbi:peptidoglycan recognition protein family protein [Candidatus Xiphinematobacter sp. Idaho Grape]|uniref:peptidoglycan recognition protein family protein n=1 Tax=Candidatus Xiphinematobacter sp. Idaho Grape TaxID=1704307 RepID=UPI00130D794F|nr:peptidoglycan recognition family protein [Candidatus Xiphinematobacter sp. Idaho Grape]
MSPRPRIRSALKKDGLCTTVATTHTVESIFQQKPVVAGSARSSGKERRYLTPTVRRAIDRAPVRRGRWKYIIIHNSGTRRGNARAFDAYHRRVRRMKNGLAYHFVIGNGRLSRNGEIEVGNRWRKQINGGHVASDYLNNIAIGVCLVGDFNRHAPTPQQLAACKELTSCLQARVVGHPRRRRVMVLGHLEVNSRPTDCPGRRFSLHWLHRKFPSR